MVDVMAVSGSELDLANAAAAAIGCGDRVVGGDRKIVKRRKWPEIDAARPSESPLRGLSEISRSLGAITRSWRANAQAHMAERLIVLAMRAM